MRSRGHQREPVGLGSHGHACLVYDEDEQVQSAVAAFLREGLELNQRIACVATDAEMAIALERLDGAGTLIESGALVCLPLETVYPGGRVDADFEHQLEIYVTATKQALEDGYDGLRGAALVTDLLIDPASRQTHLRWESFADRFMAESPFTGLCCYDARRLPEDVTRDLSAVHPVSCGAGVGPPFRIFSDRSGRAIEGELDYFDCDELDRLLILTENDPGDLSLDMTGLSFIDARAMLTIEKYRKQAEAAGKQTRIGTSSPAVGRIAELLEIKL